MDGGGFKCRYVFEAKGEAFLDGVDFAVVYLRLVSKGAMVAVDVGGVLPLEGIMYCVDGPGAACGT